MINYDLEYLELLKVFGTNFLRLQDINFLVKMKIIKKTECIVCGCVKKNNYDYILTCRQCRKKEEEILLKKIDKKIKEIKKEN